MLKHFPNFLQTNKFVLISTCADTDRSYVILEKNLKSVSECSSCFVQLLGMTGKLCFAYLAVNNSLIQMQVEKFYFRGVALQSQAKP